MKYLLALALILVAGTAIASQYDFSNGVPSVVGTSTALYDFSNGVPAIVGEYEEPAGGTPTDTYVVVNNGALQINNGVIVID